MGEIKCGLIAASRGVTVCDTCGVQSINIAVTLTFVLQVNEVFDSALGWTAYLVSNFDVIVVTVDGRGTGYKGERWVKVGLHLNFAEKLVFRFSLKSATLTM